MEAVLIYFGALYKMRSALPANPLSYLLNILALFFNWRVTVSRKRCVCKSLIVMLGTGKAIEAVKQISYEIL